MKKVLSLFVCVALILTVMVVPVSATETDTIIWDAETSSNTVIHETYGSKDSTKFSDRGTVIKEEAQWYDHEIIGVLLPEVVTKKVVNLSFDFYADTYTNGAPNFRVNLFEQNESYAQGAGGWYMGFRAWDPAKGNAFSEGKLSYYGASSLDKANADPVDETTSVWNNNNIQTQQYKWHHVDCVYDLNNRTAFYYVDGELLGSYVPSTVAKGTVSAIGAIAIRMMNNDRSWGTMYFDNVRLTEIKADGLTWSAETEASDNSFLLNFSQPVTTLAAGMISATDMETLESAAIASVEKVTSQQWRVKLAQAKANAEYKVSIAGLAGDFGSTSNIESVYANTGRVPIIDATHDTAKYIFDDLDAVPNWWGNRISTETSGVAGENTKYFIETTSEGETPAKRLRIQNTGDWTETATLGMSGVGIQFGLPNGAKKVEIAFDAAYKKDKTLLPYDAVRKTERTTDNVNYETGAFGTVQLALGQAHIYKHVMNFGSETLYKSDFWGSMQSKGPINGVTLTNNLDDLKSYKLVYDLTTAKLSAYYEGTWVYDIAYDAGTKIFGVCFATMLSNKEGKAAEEGAVLGADSNTLVVDNIVITTTYDDTTNFGVKKVRYDGTASNTSTTTESLGEDDFSSYTTKADAAANATNENDYAVTSNGMWSRHNHEQTGVWWGYGTYVNKSGQLNIDTFQSAVPIEMGAVRKLKADSGLVNTDVLNVSFDAAYNAIEAAGDSSFTLYAGDYPIFNINRTEVALYDEQLVDEKLYVGANEGGVTNLKDINVVFDFINKQIKLHYDQSVKTTKMCDELADDGIYMFRFLVNNTVNTEDNGNNGNCTFVMDNYSAEILTIDQTPTYITDDDALGKIAPTTTSIDIEFTDAVDEDTISGIAIADADGNSVAYTPSLSTDNKILSLAVALDANTDYIISVPATVASADGVANNRAYSFLVSTDKMIKFYDALGNELTDEQLATATYATVEVLTGAPTAGSGKCAYIYAIYDKTTDMLKSARLEELAYADGEVVEHSNEIDITADEYAKVFVWEYNNALSPMCDDYTIAK